MTVDVDFLVVGGGPSGAVTAARLGAGGARVALVERSDYSRFRAGETLAPYARKLLSVIGVDVGERSAWAQSAAGSVSRWREDECLVTPSIRSAYGQGLCVDRRELDKRLFHFAGQCGTQLFSSSRITFARRQCNQWTFDLQVGRQVLAGRAGHVVEATGRNGKSSFAPDNGRHWYDRLVGVTFVTTRTASDLAVPYAHSAMIEAVPKGWWYSVHAPIDQAIAVFFTDADMLPPSRRATAQWLEKQVQLTESVAIRCSPIIREIRALRWRVFDARTSVRKIVAADGWTAIGDAAMAFDPLSGQGIQLAFTAGIATADYLLSPAAAQPDAAMERSLSACNTFNKLLVQRRDAYAAHRRWDNEVFWSRRRTCLGPLHSGNVADAEAVNNYFNRGRAHV